MRNKKKKIVMKMMMKMKKEMKGKRAARPA